MTFSSSVMPDARESSEGVSTSPITLRDATSADAPALAHLMYTEIHWGRLRDFGLGFLTVLHRAFSSSPNAVCVVAEVDGRVVGYCAAFVHLARFYREFALRHGVAAAVAIVPKLFRVEMLRTFWKGVSYRNDPGPDGPQSEIAVFAVDRAFSGRGIGNKLLDATMSRLRARGVEAVRVGTVTEGNKAALAVYGRYGFKVVKTQTFYGDSQVHVMEYRFKPDGQ